jgi:O-antigen/teichoic acid export membrane protein
MMRPGVEPLPDRLTAAKDAAQAGLSLRINFVSTLLGNVCYVACQCGQLVVLGRLGGPELVGQYALGLAVAAPIIGLANLQLSAVLATDTRRQYLFADYLALRLLTTTLALIAIAIVAASSGHDLTQIALVVAVGVAKAIESVSEVIYGLFQQQERMDRTSRSMILKGILALGALGGGLWLTGSLLWAVLLLAAVWAILLVAYDLPNACSVLAIDDARGVLAAAAPWESIWPRCRPAALWSLAKSSLPLGISALLTALTINIPRYVIEGNCGPKALGAYAGCANVLAGLFLMQVALGNATLPRLASYYQQGELRKYWSLAGKIALCGAAIGAANIILARLAGRQIMSWLYSAQFADFGPLFVWLAVLSAVQCQAGVLGFLLSARRRFNTIAIVGCANLAITAASCLWLVQRHGILGGVYGQLIGTCAAILLFCLLWRRANRGAHTYGGQIGLAAPLVRR